MIVPLERATDEVRFGGKAVQLGAALRVGLPVPAGCALSVDLVEAVVAGEADARESVTQLFSSFAVRRVACRSSAVGEDSSAASFAGQHLTRLNVVTPDALAESVVEVWRSGRTPSALAYRARLGLESEPKIAVVVQQMVEPRCAGVMFTRNPLTGADERVIEATWGLGEAVVSGVVTPDRYRVSRGGAVLERSAGEKDLMIRCTPDGDTEEVAVDAGRAAALCLTDAHLRELDVLASRCERHFSGEHDIEWALVDEQVVLLQRRAVTR